MAKSPILMAKCRMGGKNAKKDKKRAFARDIGGLSGPDRIAPFLKNDVKIT